MIEYDAPTPSATAGNVLTTKAKQLLAVATTCTALMIASGCSPETDAARDAHVAEQSLVDVWDYIESTERSDRIDNALKPLAAQFIRAFEEGEPSDSRDFRSLAELVNGLYKDDDYTVKNEGWGYLSQWGNMRAGAKKDIGMLLYRNPDGSFNLDKGVQEMFIRTEGDNPEEELIVVFTRQPSITDFIENPDDEKPWRVEYVPLNSDGNPIPDETSVVHVHEASRDTTVEDILDIEAKALGALQAKMQELDKG